MPLRPLRRLLAVSDDIAPGAAPPRQCQPRPARVALNAFASGNATTFASAATAAPIASGTSSQSMLTIINDLKSNSSFSLLGFGTEWRATTDARHGTDGDDVGIAERIQQCPPPRFSCTPPAEFFACELAAVRSASQFRQQLETHSLLPPAPSSLQLITDASSSPSSSLSFASATVPSSSSLVIVPPLATGGGARPPNTVSGENVRKEIKHKLQLRAFKMRWFSSTSLSASSPCRQSVEIVGKMPPPFVPAFKCQMMPQQQQQPKQKGTERSEDKQKQQNWEEKKQQNGEGEKNEEEEAEAEEQFICHICNKDFRRPDILSR